MSKVNYGPILQGLFEGLGHVGGAYIKTRKESDAISTLSDPNATTVQKQAALTQLPKEKQAPYLESMKSEIQTQRDLEIRNRVFGNRATNLPESPLNNAFGQFGAPFGQTAQQPLQIPGVIPPQKPGELGKKPLEEMTRKELFEMSTLPGDEGKLWGKVYRDRLEQDKLAQQERLAIQKMEKQQNQAARQETLKIHLAEKPKYDELQQFSKDAKRSMRARDVMKAQLQSGKLDNKNIKNIFANAFKDHPVLEGLLTTPEREVFKSAGITQYEGMKDIFGVRLSDADLAIASSKVMDPSKPVEANLAIAEYWDFLDKMKIEQAKIAQEIKRENGGLLPLDWEEQADQIMQERFGGEAQKVVENAATEGGTKQMKIVDNKVVMIAPDGTRKLVPMDQVKQAMLAGGTPE